MFTKWLLAVFAISCTIFSEANGRQFVLEDEFKFDFIVERSFVTEAPPKISNIWAVLVAGSKSWFNYRHQADICHAYQVLHRHGVPDERIIVLMYDDIANNDENPNKGVIINRPNGTDVYGGVKKDYTGEEVTPETFLKVLTGDRDGLTGSGAVLNSTEDDHVFVYFSDHGAPGLVAFPAGQQPVLHARDLNKALRTMAEKKMFAKLVFYLEACESGSMFSHLSNDLNIYAVTAANATESSYACYFDQELGTYLGDTFSVNWMEDSDQENIKVETLLDQFDLVKNKTTSSHVEEFGDTTIAELPVAVFQGEESAETTVYDYYPLGEVPSEDVPLEQLYRQLQGTSDSATIAALQQQIKDLKQKRGTLEEAVNDMLRALAMDEESFSELVYKVQEIQNYDCYEPVVHAFHGCISFTENNYALRQLYKFVNACEIIGNPGPIIEAIDQYCIVSGMTGIH